MSPLAEVGLGQQRTIGVGGYRGERFAYLRVLRAEMGVTGLADEPVSLRVASWAHTKSAPCFRARSTISVTVIVVAAKSTSATFCPVVFRQITISLTVGNVVLKDGT